MGSGDLTLVTGATGFLGRHLVPALIEAGYPVRAFVRSTSDTKALRSLGVELAHGEVTNAGDVDQAVRGVRHVVHAAGLFRFWGPPRQFERVNVEGTAYVMEACARHGVERVVHVSTIALVGIVEPGQVIDETYPSRPADAYQRSKLDGENIVRLFVASAHVPAVILRPGAFYGPWGRYAFNRLFFEDPLRGLRIKVHGGRRITFPAFVPDVARAIVAALSRGRVGEVYNVSGEPITHNAANEIISRLAGISPFRVNVPAGVMLAMARAMERAAEATGREPYYPLNLANYVFTDWPVSSHKARAELHFQSTPFVEGARQTLDWYYRMGYFKRIARLPKASPAGARAGADSRT